MPLASPALEAWFNRYERAAEYSLGGTMVEPWKGQDLEGFFPLGFGPKDFAFGYVATPGSLSTRALIAADEGLRADELFLTSGASEANHAVLRGMLRAGDNVVLQHPLYYQFAALAAEAGAEVRPWEVPADPYDEPDLAALAGLVDAQTRLVVLNTPHNPTGRCFDASQLSAVVRLVEASPRAHLLVDEVYRGVGMDAPSAVSLSDRVLVTNAVSKRWALPGLRLGWVASRSEALASCLPYHEYATCCVSRLSEQVIEALWPRREALFSANRAVVERNRVLFGAWLAAMQPLLRGHLSPSGVVSLIYPRWCEDDREVARALAEDFGLFCLPGSTLGYPGALRVGYGHRDAESLLASLARLETGMRALSGVLA